MNIYKPFAHSFKIIVAYPQPYTVCHMTKKLFNTVDPFNGLLVLNHNEYVSLVQKIKIRLRFNGVTLLERLCSL